MRSQFCSCFVVVVVVVNTLGSYLFFYVELSMVDVSKEPNKADGRGGKGLPDRVGGWEGWFSARHGKRPSMITSWGIGPLPRVLFADPACLPHRAVVSLFGARLVATMK